MTEPGSVGPVLLQLQPVAQTMAEWAGRRQADWAKETDGLAAARVDGFTYSESAITAATDERSVTHRWRVRSSQRLLSPGDN